MGKISVFWYNFILILLLIHKNKAKINLQEKSLIYKNMYFRNEFIFIEEAIDAMFIVFIA